MNAGNGVDNAETNYELTYRAPINKWLTVQPDLQYIVDPGTNPAVRDDMIIGVRFEVGQGLSW